MKNQILKVIFCLITITTVSKANSIPNLWGGIKLGDVKLKLGSEFENNFWQRDKYQDSEIYQSKTSDNTYAGISFPKMELIFQSNYLICARFEKKYDESDFSKLKIHFNEVINEHLEIDTESQHFWWQNESQSGSVLLEKSEFNTINLCLVSGIKITTFEEKYQSVPRIEAYLNWIQEITGYPLIKHSTLEEQNELVEKLLSTNHRVYVGKIIEIDRNEKTAIIQTQNNFIIPFQNGEILELANVDRDYLQFIRKESENRFVFKIRPNYQAELINIYDPVFKIRQFNLGGLIERLTRQELFHKRSQDESIIYIANDNGAIIGELKILRRVEYMLMDKKPIQRAEIKKFIDYYISKLDALFKGLEHINLTNRVADTYSIAFKNEAIPEEYIYFNPTLPVGIKMIQNWEKGKFNDFIYSIYETKLSDRNLLFYAIVHEKYFKNSDKHFLSIAIDNTENPEKLTNKNVITNIDKKYTSEKNQEMEIFLENLHKHIFGQNPDNQNKRKITFKQNIDEPDVIGQINQIDNDLNGVFIELNKPVEINNTLIIRDKPDIKITILKIIEALSGAIGECKDSIDKIEIGDKVVFAE